MTFRARDQLRAGHQHDWYRPPHGEISRNDVYNKLPAIPIDGEPTSETCRQADRLFDRSIRRTSAYKSYKEQSKRVFLQQLLHAAKRALYHGGCVRYSRDPKGPGCLPQLCRLSIVQLRLACLRNTVVHQGARK